MPEKKLIAISKTMGIFEENQQFHFEDYVKNNKTWKYYRVLFPGEIPNKSLKVGDMFSLVGVRFVYIGYDTPSCSSCGNPLYTDFNKINYNTFYKGFCSNCGELNFLKHEEPFHCDDDFGDDYEDDFDDEEGEEE